MGVYGLTLVCQVGRAMFWGSVLALWGTAGVFLTAKRSLGIDSSEDASERLAAVMTPYADWFHQRCAPRLAVTFRVEEVLVNLTVEFGIGRH
jgi:hypothetical protein